MNYNVDTADHELIKNHSWFVCNGYLATMVGKKMIYMHRMITSAPSNFDVDHINGDKLDNRRCNLRICHHHDNMANRTKHTVQTSKYKGVSWRKTHKLWQATITKYGTQTHLGYFTSQEEAALAYNKAALKIHGEFAKLNKVD